jgi:HK97 family phage major capsid protein
MKKMKKSLQSIKDRSLIRNAEITELKKDEKGDRRISLSFSSEEPYERWFGMEILNHANENVDLEFLNSGNAPLLLDHDPEKVIGIIESCVIKDRRGLAIVRFSENKIPSEIYKDVMDGIRKNISVGYRIHDLKLNEIADENIETYDVTKWRPFEISIVSIPADETVGIGRSNQNEKEISTEKKDKIMVNIITEDNTNISQEKAALPAETVADAMKVERNRSTEILALGRAHNQQIAADKAVQNGATIGSFKSYILENLSQGQDLENPVTHLDLTKKDKQEYSLFRAINAYLRNDESLAPFEMECSKLIQEKLGRTARGILVPYDIQKRTMQVGTANLGGDLVDTDLRTGDFIEMLRNKAVVTTLGAKILSGLVGDIEIPKQTGKATFYWLGEDIDVTDSDLEIGTVKLTPKTVAGSVPMTRKLLTQSSMDVESLIINDLITGVALAIDAAAINGSGAAGQPRGIMNTTGVGTIPITVAGEPTWDNVVGFETKMTEDNALIEKADWLMSPAVRGHCKTTLKSAGVAGYLMSEGGELNGYDVHATNQMPANGILKGDFSSLVVGMWGVLDIVPDKAAKAASAGLILRVFQDVDFALRHAQSFVKNS